jgi:hypothetical protein
MIGATYIPLQIYGEPDKADDVVVVETRYGTFRTTVVNCQVVREEVLVDGVFKDVENAND